MSSVQLWAESKSSVRRKAMQSAKESIPGLLKLINSKGYSDDSIERMLRLDEGTVAKWKRCQKLNPESIALIRLLYVHPNALHLVNSGMDLNGTVQVALKKWKVAETSSQGEIATTGKSRHAYSIDRLPKVMSSVIEDNLNRSHCILLFTGKFISSVKVVYCTKSILGIGQQPLYKMNTKLDNIPQGTIIKSVAELKQFAEKLRKDRKMRKDVEKGESTFVILNDGLLGGVVELVKE